jgi:outer membrane protein OmpA-like peptidoglycan-associated protein
MKKQIVSFVFLCVVAFCAFAQNLNLQPADAEKPEFKWLGKTEYDFGKIPQGTPATAVFDFENSGKTELILSNVKPSCGCTTPNYTKSTLAGQRGKIEATYNAASAGVFHKTITVSSNVGEQPVILTIKGEVVPSDSKPAVAATPAVEPAKPMPVATSPVVTTPAPVATPESGKISTSHIVYFDNGSTSVKSSDVTAVKKIAEGLKSNASQGVIVSGYASKVGKASVNKRLSESRAEAVKSLLVKSGITADRIIVQSYGDENASTDGKDRRVELSVFTR